jgi:hypothetical protein
MYNPIYNQLYLVNGHNCSDCFVSSGPDQGHVGTPGAEAPGQSLAARPHGAMPIRFVDARWSEIWREKDRKNNEEYNLDIWICGYIMVCIYIWYVWVCLNKHMWKTLKNRWCTINPLTKLHSFGYHHLSTHPYIKYNLDRKVICNFSLHVGGVLLIYFFWLEVYWARNACW